MNRIPALSHDAASVEQRELLAAIQNKLGMVPNFLKVLAQSPDALRAFLGLHQIAESGSLAPQTRERIALVVAEENSCEYCLSAHTAIGRKAGLDNNEMTLNRQGSSSDQKAAAAVTFAKALNDHLGDVTNGEIQAVRDAGYDNAEIVEMITHVGLNILTNIIGKASQVDIDFPKVTLEDKAA